MTTDADHPHGVIRFKRPVTFPRFSVAAGERWGFVIFGKLADRLDKIRRGERFDFAGGLCLAEDVEIIYEGPADIDYSVACGYVAPEAAQRIKAYKEQQHAQ